MDQAEEDRIIRIAKALSDKTRIKILKQISEKGSVRCGDVEAIADLSQPTFSHHLKILAAADLLITEKTGRCIIISLNKKILDQYTTFITDSFKE